MTQVLLFSQFTTMLDLLDEYIELRGWNRYRIDGRGGHGANQDEINEFNTAPFSEDSKPHEKPHALSLSLTVMPAHSRQHFLAVDSSRRRRLEPGWC